jgi:hypothetical protein
MTKIKLGDIDLDVNNYTEEKIKENEEEILVRSFECDALDDQERKKLSKQLSSQKIALSVEESEPVDVMPRNWSEHFADSKPPYHFRIELVPYKKKYGLQDFTMTPIITLIKLTEGLIKVLKEKGILKNGEISNMVDKIFSDENARNEILDLYFGPEIAEHLKSLKEKS